MILHPIVRVQNTHGFESKNGDGNIREDIVVFIIVSLAPAQFFLDACIVVGIIDGWDRLTGVMVVG